MTELDALIRNVVRHSTFFCAVILQNISSTPKSRSKENLRSSRQPDKESHSRGGPARHRVFTIHAASSPLFCTSRTGSNCCPLTDRPPAACDPILTLLLCCCKPRANENPVDGDERDGRAGPVQVRTGSPKRTPARAEGIDPIHDSSRGEYFCVCIHHETARRRRPRSAAVAGEGVRDPKNF